MRLSLLLHIRKQADVRHDPPGRQSSSDGPHAFDHLLVADLRLDTVPVLASYCDFMTPSLSHGPLAPGTHAAGSKKLETDTPFETP
jgi:hypothetical protein